MNKVDGSDGETGARQERPGSDVPTKDPNADVYDNRGPKKIIRVVTVMAYLFSVSFVGILLSGYYIFLWEPPNPRLVERLRTEPAARMQLLIAAADPSADPHSDLSLETRKSNRTSLFGGATTGREDAYDETLIGRMDLTAESRRDHQAWDGRVSSNTMSRVFKVFLRARNPHNSSEHGATSEERFVQVRRVSDSTRKMDYPRLRSIESTERGNDTDSPSESLAAFGNASKNVENTDSAEFESASKTIPGTKTNENYFEVESNTDADIRYSTAPSSAIDRAIGAPRPLANRIASQLLRVRGLSEAGASGGGSTGRSDRPLSVVNANVNSSVAKREEKAWSARGPADSSEDPVTNRSIIVEPPAMLHDTTRNTEETQIEKMTARSATMDDNHLRKMDSSIETEVLTGRQRSLWEILTETADMEEIASVEPASISTTRNYRNNLTSTANDDDQSVT